MSFSNWHCDIYNAYMALKSDPCRQGRWNVLNQEKYCIYGLCPGAFCDQSICYIFSRVVQNDKLRWELGRKTDGQKRIMGKVY